MTEPLLIQRQRTLLRDLIQLVADRVRAETAAESGFTSSQCTAEQEFEQTRGCITGRFESDLQAVEREYRDTHELVTARFESEYNAAQRESGHARNQVEAQFLADQDRARRELQEVRWEATAVLDAAKIAVKAQFKETEAQIDVGAHKFRSVEEAAIKLLDEWQQPRDFGPANPTTSLESDSRTAHARFEDCIRQAQSQLGRLKKLAVPQLFNGNRLRWMFVAFWFVSIASLWWITDRPFTLKFENLIKIIVCVVGPIPFSLAIRAILFAIAKSQVVAVCLPLAQSLADCEAAGKQCLEEAAANHKRQREVLQHRHNGDMAQAETRCGLAIAEAKVRRDAALREVEAKYPRLLAEITQQRDAGLKGVEEKYPGLIAEIRQRFETQLCAVEEKHRQQLSESHTRHEEDWAVLARHWWQGIAAMQSEVTEINCECRRLFPVWSLTTAREWLPPKSIPPAIRFGEFRVSMDRIPNGLPDDARLKGAVPEEFSLPALLPFPAGCSLLIKARDAGRSQAAETLQAVMLRMLTSVPPSKVRFTIIDPVGLGENFAAFMHLADYDEQLVSNRIWTEPQHIDHRLADLTEHMENVIQKYLRNEFQTIEEYNAQAGEVAEPFRIVVVANFPTNFNEASARRLVSIASSGARCGVYTLVSVDTRLPMPHGFSLADLEQHALVLQWDEDHFMWKHPDFGKFPLVLDTMPASEKVTSLLQVVGEKAKEAGRVEVPFEFVAPRPEQYWTSDSRPGLSVPLGRSGATKMQHLRLGQGTAQHVLIAGKTGSGKSTLLHALITNLSLMYSPDEVQLYLVDFKKGVEFKTYATYELPHARVVAIESEREFGLSVLQRLDGELKRRGDLFRSAGVQDLAGFRQSNGLTPLPRILLIVDEFQEFFVEDDKIAQESALLLDRLVRQGRAFGIHVQLGSQTLGGAYSLARSTLGQMAVRIALQCSEADAHLILSDDNTAARLLSRPGEAIYNDANGLIEGNNFFQVVWLSDDKREEYLRRVQELARHRHYTPPQPQIVFEGNVPSDIQKNHLFQQLLTASGWPEPPKPPQAWLGEAVAIKDPTAAVFRPQSGSNLIMIGQQDESAKYIMLSSLVSLAAHHAPAVESESAAGRGTRFYILDGSPTDSPHAGFFARLAGLVPHPVQVVGPREIQSVVTAVAEEVDRRQKADQTEFAPIYLFVYDLQRFRELRRQDDDFSFSRRSDDAPPNPSKRFGNILRDGSAVRVHTIIWCDSLTNMNRTFERQTIREFDMRVLFQMSTGDSSTLIDTPVASKLGLHRAIFFSEEQGQAEKFRPYGMPPDAWLSWVRSQLQAKAASLHTPSVPPQAS